MWISSNLFVPKHNSEDDFKWLVEGDFHRVEELDKGMFSIQSKTEDSVGYQTTDFVQFQT